MIIFGTRSASLKASQEEDYDCNYCKTEKSVRFYFFQRYIHIFWIPFIPIGKTGSSVCSHCKQVLEVQQMPESQKQTFISIKKDLKTPLSYKIALILLIALIATPFLIGIFHNLFR